MTNAVAMEDKVKDIIEVLKLTEAKDKKFFIIFDNNGKVLYAFGRPRLSERDARNIRHCMSCTITYPFRIQFGNCKFFCMKLSNGRLGRGNFNASTSNRSKHHVKAVVRDAPAGGKTERKDLNKASIKAEENLMFAAKRVDKFTIVLMGQPAFGESFLQQVNQVLAMLTSDTFKEMSETDVSTRPV